MKAYDTFERKSIEIFNLTEFLKAYGLYNRKNRQTVIHFGNRTKHCLDRFVNEEFKDEVVFTMYCIDDDVDYECVSSNGFLIQVGAEQDKSTIHEINRMKYGPRKTISINGKLYCLSHNKEGLSNFSLCSQYYKSNTQSYDKNKQLQKIQRRLSNSLRSRVRAAVLLKSESTFELIGCSVEFLMGWLESKFTEGMSWDNYGEWHIDHIKPCASFDLSDPAQQKECFHYSNLQPLWASDNFRKGSSY